MQCNARTLKVFPLSEAHNGLVTSYGVYGCGVRSVFTLMPTGAWVQTSTTRAGTQPRR